MAFSKKQFKKVWPLVALIILLDAATKILARLIMAPSDYIENAGFAFGFPMPMSLIIYVTMGIIIFIFLSADSQNLTRAELLGVTLILGGAVANLLERIFFGAVTDFIHLGRGYFNLADLVIFAGVGLLVVTTFRLTKSDNQNHLRGLTRD